MVVGTITRDYARCASLTLCVSITVFAKPSGRGFAVAESRSGGLVRCVAQEYLAAPADNDLNAVAHRTGMHPASWWPDRGIERRSLPLRAVRAAAGAGFSVGCLRMQQSWGCVVLGRVFYAGRQGMARVR